MNGVLQGPILSFLNSEVGSAFIHQIARFVANSANLCHKMPSAPTNIERTNEKVVLSFADHLGGDTGLPNSWRVRASQLSASAKTCLKMGEIAVIRLGKLHTDMEEWMEVQNDP